MTDQKPVTSTVTGTVTSVSQFGVRLDGGEEWINLPYGVKDVILPTRGMRVTLTLNAKGKILHIVRAAEQQSAPESPQTHQEAQPAAKTDWARKDALMVRMSCLRGACEIVAACCERGQGAFPSAAVTRLAETFERWVNREGDEPFTPHISAGSDVVDWTADVVELSPAEPPTVDAGPAAPVQAPGAPLFATAEMVEIIRDDVRRLGWNSLAARKWLHECYGTPDPTLLTLAQGAAAIEALSREHVTAAARAGAR